MASQDGPLVRANGRPFVGPRAMGNIRALASAIFATGDGPPSVQRLDWLCTEVEDFLARIGPARRTFSLGLFALSVMTPIVAGRLTPMAKLPLPDLVLALTKIERSPAAGIVLGMKMLLCILYYEHPGAARDVGFDGRCLVDAND